MDHSAARKLVDANLAPLQRAMGIPHWRISVELGPIGDGGPGWVNTGTVLIKPRYERAMVKLDPENIEDAAKLIEVLVHELAHVLLSPFLLYRDFAASMIQSGSSQDAQEDAIWPHCDDLAVRNIERMWEAAVAHGRATPEKKAPRRTPGRRP